MKRICLFFCALHALCIGYAQSCQPFTISSCTPNMSLTGIISEYNNFTCIEKGSPFNNSFTIKIPTTYSALGTQFDIYSLKIDSIGNLPCGLCWSASDTGFINAGSAFCITIQGTTADITGVYKLNITGTINASFGILPGNLDIVGAQFYVRVIDNGVTCPSPIIQPADLSHLLVACTPIPCINPGWLPVTTTPIAGQPCNYSSINYTVEPPFTNVSWVCWDTIQHKYDSIASSTFNPVIHSASSLQSIMAIDSLGCPVQMDGVQLTNTGGYKYPSICIATLDSSINKNVIVWQRTDDSYISTISHYNIYSNINDSLPTPDNLIGTIPVNNETIFTDTVNPPLSGVIKYQLTMVDTCGFEIRSEVFAPPYLRVDTVLGRAYLRWNYHGSIFSDFLSGFYYNMQVWKTYDGQNWQSVPIGANNISGTDFGLSRLNYDEALPDSGFVQYMVQYFVQNACTPSPQRTSTYSYVYSNRVLVNTAPGVTTDMGNIDNLSGVLAFPNPTTGTLTVSVNKNAPLVTGIKLYDLTGRPVRLLPFTAGNNSSFSSTYNLGELSSGMYLLKVESATKTFVKIIAVY